jgi:hypothetical protein
MQVTAKNNDLQDTNLGDSWGFGEDFVANNSKV